MATTKKPTTNEDKEPTITKTLKKSSCKSLSGNGTLHYEIGLDDNGVAHIRITENTGGGFFNSDWVPVAEIVKLIEKQPEVEAISSIVLWPLFRGRSANTPGYMLAILEGEGLLERIEGRKRGVRRVPAGQFKTAVSKLTSGSTTAAKKPATRKKAAKAKPKRAAKR